MLCPVLFSSHVYANNILGAGNPVVRTVRHVSAINWEPCRQDGPPCIRNKLGTL
jgi:hypothetical protein